MKLFIFEAAYRRLEAEIHAICPAVEPYLMAADGTITLHGKPLASEDVTPEIAWISTDLFFQGPSRDFLRFVLKCDSLKWIQSGAAGFDNPIFQALGSKPGVIYTNSTGAGKSIAEFVMGAVLNYFQPHTARRDSQRRHEWKRYGFRDVAETNWLIYGYGNIGSEVGKRARAFEAHVTGVRRNPTGEENADRMIRPDALYDNLPQMDVVVLAAASNEDNRHIVDARFLAAMKPTSVLVNVGRGALVDEVALLASLDKGRPEQAILDVFETEPLPGDSPLWDHPRVHVSAHASASSPMTGPRGDEVFLRNFRRYVLGDEVELQVRFEKP